MENKEYLINEFIKKSSMVGNTNKIITLGELKKDIIQEQYNYIFLNNLKELNKTINVSKAGLNKTMVEAEMGIAETGSVILTKQEENYRRATELCEELIVVLPSSKIVYSLENTVPLLKKSLGEHKKAYVVFITGASRTADIEMTLTLGVHGPKTMKILIVIDL